MNKIKVSKKQAFAIALSGAKKKKKKVKKAKKAVGYRSVMPGSGMSSM